jgi:hypothetical protein
MKMSKVQNVVSYGLKKINLVKTLVFGVALTVMSFACGLAHAAPVDIEVTPPDINFSKVATDVLAACVPGILAGIGLALSLWAFYFIYRSFRKVGT